MAIWTGTVSVTNGSANVHVTSGAALNQFNCTPDSAVVIKANGREIGKGALLRIEDHIGVRILELYRER